MKVKRGEIYLADLSDASGSEQGKVRPVVIIQNNRGNKYSPTIIVAAITAKLGKTHMPTHVDLPRFIQNIIYQHIIFYQMVLD